MREKAILKLTKRENQSKPLHKHWACSMQLFGFWNWTLTLTRGLLASGTVSLIFLNNDTAHDEWIQKSTQRASSGERWTRQTSDLTCSSPHEEETKGWNSSKQTTTERIGNTNVENHHKRMQQWCFFVMSLGRQVDTITAGNTYTALINY